MLLSSSNTFWAISCLYVFKSSFNLGYFILIICIAINAAFNPESIVTVATVTIDSGLNAVLMAMQIMSIKYPKLKKDLKAYRKEMADKVLNDDENLRG